MHKCINCFSSLSLSLSLPPPLPPLSPPPLSLPILQGNYVPPSDSTLGNVTPEYDVILGLSLTKWIHLNWGDEGMKRFFRKIYLHLRPGGKFIVEPQPFASYTKKKKVTVSQQLSAILCLCSVAVQRDVYASCVCVSHRRTFMKTINASSFNPTSFTAISCLQRWAFKDTSTLASLRTSQKVSELILPL